MASRRPLSLTSALGLMACASWAGACGASRGDETVSSSVSAITGGRSDASEQAVVALLSAGQVLCSGTVISQRVILTAAHCLQACAPDALEVSVGQVPDFGGEPIAVTEQWVHPLFDPVTHANDIALLVTSEPVPVAVKPMNRVSPGSVVGDAVRIVGFGRTSAGSDAPLSRHAGTSIIADLDDTTLRLRPDPSLPCYGDSGGPVLLDVNGTEQVFGVVSYGNESCTSYAVATRVDAYTSDFLDAFSSVHTVPAGGRCLFSGNCRDGECVAPPDAPSISYCDSACSAPKDCAAPLVCAPAATGSRCRYAEPAPGALGTACTRDIDCNSTLCVHAAGRSASVCTTACFPNDPDPCSEGYACLEDPDVAGASACFPASATPAHAASCSMHDGPRPEGRAELLAISLALSAFVRRIHRSSPVP
jgi:Trypsin